MRAFAARLRDGWEWAAIFNSAPSETIYTASGAPNFEAMLQNIFSVEALRAVQWPEDIDLFPQYLRIRTPPRPQPRR